MAPSTTATASSTLSLEKILASAQLPALPQSAIRLLEVSQDPKNGPEEFALPIETDPGLTGQVLRFVNSSYFGFSREISSVRLALTLVGIRTIKNFALWSAVFSLMPNPKCGPFPLKCLWQDSLRRALFARSMSKLLGLQEAEEAFSAALLQDMAVPVLAKEKPQIYQQLLATRQRDQVRLTLLEREAFGWTHAQAGAMMARNWNLPEQFATLIEAHQELEQWLAGPTTQPAKTAVALSSLLPASADAAWNECQDFDGAYQRVTPAGSPGAGEILPQIDEQYAEFAPMLKLGTPTKSLAEAYQEAQAATTG